MVQLNQTYVVDDLGELEDYTPIPKGSYSALITESDMVETSSGNGAYLKLTIDITQGEYQGRKLFERLNLVNENELAVKIAQKTLGSICRAVGVDQINDSVVLHNIPFMIDVDIEQGKPYMKDGEQRDGRPQNVIKKYHQLSKAPQQAQSAHASGQAPVGGAPSAQAQTGGSVPPWKK